MLRQIVDILHGCFYSRFICGLVDDSGLNTCNGRVTQFFRFTHKFSLIQRAAPLLELFRVVCHHVTHGRDDRLHRDGGGITKMRCNLDALVEMAIMFGFLMGPILSGVVIGKLLRIKGFEAFKW